MNETINKILVEGIKGHGGVQDKFDSRDKQFKDIASSTPEFDWNKGFDVEKELGFKIKIKDQGSSSACGGFAWAYLAEILEALSTKTYEPRSAKYIYAQTNLPGGGSSGRDNADVFLKQGVARESVLSSQPATEENLTASIDITTAIRADATKDMSRAYSQTGGYDIDTIAKALRDNYGVILGIDGQNGHDWLSAFPTPPSSANINEIWRHWVLGCKAKLIDGKKYIGIINSWGSNIGELGIQWLSEKYFTSGHVWSGWTHIFNPPITKPSKPTVAPFLVDMAYGQTSNEIIRLQLYLSGLGYFHATPTGYYGDLTRDAVFSFQKDYVTLNSWEYFWERGSKVGPKTRAALNTLLNN